MPVESSDRMPAMPGLVLAKEAGHAMSGQAASLARVAWPFT